MKLSLGEIELNGVSFRKNMGMDDVLSSTKFSHYANNSIISLFMSEQVNVNGYIFKVNAFFVNKRINKIQLFPIELDMEDPYYPDEKYQEKKRRLQILF